jgi:hypothetical protein
MRPIDENRDDALIFTGIGSLFTAIAAVLLDYPMFATIFAFFSAFAVAVALRNEWEHRRATLTLTDTPGERIGSDATVIGVGMAASVTSAGARSAGMGAAERLPALAGAGMALNCIGGDGEGSCASR